MAKKTQAQKAAPRRVSRTVNLTLSPEQARHVRDALGFAVDALSLNLSRHVGHVTEAQEIAAAEKAQKMLASMEYGAVMGAWMSVNDRLNRISRAEFEDWYWGRTEFDGTPIGEGEAA